MSSKRYYLHACVLGDIEVVMLFHNMYNVSGAFTKQSANLSAAYR